MLPVTEGLLVAVLGMHLVLLVFVAWQIAQCLRRVALHIRRARRLVYDGKMDCDELIDELMSVADPQGQRQRAGAGLAEGLHRQLPQRRRQTRRRRKNGCKNTANGSLPSRREAKPGSTDWWSVGKHSPPIKSTLWTIPKSRRCTPATKQGLGRR